MKLIEVGRDFSTTPGGRTSSLGPHSGEKFREMLVEALDASGSDEVRVRLDGTAGYGSSFLEEAFGGVVRLGRFPPREIEKRLRIEAVDPIYETYAEEAREYLAEAIRIAAN